MYSFYSVCAHHKSFLNTECGGCGSAVVIGGEGEEGLYCCVTCGRDLRSADVLCAPVSEDFCRFQSNLIVGLMTGEVRHPVAAWELLRLPTSPRRIKYLDRYINDVFGTKVFEYQPPGVAWQFAAMHWVYSNYRF